MARSLLPIGTVVKLKETDKLMMICGFCTTGPAKPGYVFDYSGFPYPEGYMDVLKIYQFDNEQIERVIALGYQDTEVFRYVSSLEQRIDDIKGQVQASYDAKEEDTPADGDEDAQTNTGDISESDYIQ